jgi:hypothetical protein
MGKFGFGVNSQQDLYLHRKVISLSLTHTHTHTHTSAYAPYNDWDSNSWSQCMGNWSILIPYPQHSFVKCCVILSSNICCSLVSRLHYSDKTCKVHIHNVNCLGMNSDINITTIIIIIKNYAKIHNAWIRKHSESRTILACAIISADSGGMWFIFQVRQLYNMI